MALIRDLSKAQMAFQITGREIDLFQVTRFSGREGIGQLFRFEIELAAAQSGLGLEAIVGKTATLSVATSEGDRWFHGICSRFEMSGETVDLTYYRAELVPSFWLLTQRYNSRIFQNKDLKVILNEVLTLGGIPADQIDMSRLAKTYPPREYCVQYRETDFNFVCRLMEEEGVWWYFEQAQAKHTLVLCEKKNDYIPIPGDAKLGYRSPSGLIAESEHIYRFRVGQGIRPGAVTLNDFNFKNPKLTLDVKSDNGRDPGLRFADFPGEYEEQGRGTDLAKIRAEEFESSRIIGYGLSNCRRLAPGKSFEMIEHPHAAFNQKYFVTSMIHQGKEAVARTSTGAGARGGVLTVRVQESLVAARTHELPAVRELAEGLLQLAGRFNAGDPTENRSMTHWLFHGGQVTSDLAQTAAAQGANPMEWLSVPNLVADIARSAVIDFDAPIYHCRFECIPATVTYRPPRVTPWPEIGTQTARVVGPDGEEIHCDEFGRVKVQFHWDREGREGDKAKLFGADSSCFIRVVQGSAGGQYGMMFIPRVGQEVVVDFLEGNPDQPLIIGRVYNKDHMPPYPLPDNKTRSVIKTHTSKGGGGNNEVRFEDLKDKEQLFIQAQRQMDTNVKANHFHTTGGSYHLHIGGEHKGELHGDYMQLVFQDKHVHIKQHQMTWIEQEEHRAVGGLQAVEIGGTRSWLMRKDAIDVFEANHQHEVTSTYYLKAADVKIEASGSIELVAGGSSIVIGSSGIYITGSMVYINSGSGPPVSPTAVAGMSPGQAKDAAVADSSKPGKDTRYSGPDQPPPQLPPPAEVPGHDFPVEDPKVVETAKIEIELLDEADQPIAGERYEITTPDGKVKHGTTDSNGRARITGIKPGACKIRFPRLDSEAWIKHPTRPTDPIT
ncbi:MAG TPA: type VI secretion system tip protein TssI/VgrG [Phycisphaerae bacterium]|nr:type VI secretion system tip protein TssI/VgrG [Phycisphaerae bacterium]